MSHLRAWIFIVTQLCLTLANPIYAPQFLTGGTGRNIRHLPCVSLRSGETGVCMFAFTCAKANGTHLGTCIDRFYFGSCCKLNEESDVYPQDNTIDEGPAAGSFVTTDSSIESNDIPDYVTRPKPDVEKGTSSTTASSSTSQTGLLTTQSVQSIKTESNNIPTKRPYFSTPYTTTQPPMALSTFQTLHNYSQGSSSAFTTQRVPQSPSSISSRPQKPSTIVTTTVSTTHGDLSRPRPSPTTSEATRRPVTTDTTTKKPSSTSSTKPAVTKKPVTSTTSRPLSSTTARTPPSTRFPPRNATTARPVPSTTRKPTTRKPIVTTKKPSSATRRPSTTPRPSSTVVLTAKPSAATDKPFSTSVKVTQTARPPVTSTQASSSTSGAKPSSSTASASSTVGETSQRPVTKRPSTTSVDDKIVTTAKPATTSRPSATSSRPRPSVTSSRPRPSSKPTKPTTTSSSGSPSTTKTTPRPQQQITEKIQPASTSTTQSSSSSRPSTSRPTTTPSARPRPTEKPTKHTKPTKPTKHTKPTKQTKPASTTHSTVASTSTSLEGSSVTPMSTLSVTSLILNGTTLTNEILPPKVPDTVATTEKVTPTSESPGLVTWSSNSDDDVTKEPGIPSSTPATTQEETTEPEWSPITTPDGWIMIQSPTTEKPAIGDDAVTRPKPTKAPATSVKPSTESTVTESAATTRPILPTILSTIATVTTATDLPVPMETLNMSDYKQVCGRRLFPESRIVGGDDSSFGKWPWQISLRQWRSKSYLHKCGAALLNENWAITAAHCVENVPPGDLLLRLGEHDLANEDEPYGFQERRVQIVATHPQFDPRTFEYDLALLRFYEPLQPFQPNLLPICLPDDDENYVGHTAYVTGWGRLYEDGILPSVLQEVSVPVLNNTMCEGMYRSAGYIEHIPHIFICAGWRKGGYDSCEGDSGGPMVIQRPRDKRWILAGVISWGIGCAEPNQPGVYTRISEFREWINQILLF